MFTIDTNILIYYANGDSKIAEFFDKNLTIVSPFILPSIVAVEFFAYPTLGTTEREIFETLLQQLTIIPLDYRIALIAGKLKREYGLKLGDSIIAATALHADSTLVTRNIRDFKKISSLQLLSI